MLDTPIIVSDEKVKGGDFMCLKNQHPQGKIRKCWYIHDNGDFQQLMTDNPDDINRGYGFCKQKEVFKIIAGIEGLPSIDWNGLEEEFGWIDVNVRDITLEAFKQGITFSHHQFSDDAYNRFRTWFSQNKKVQSLNDKKFSLEDMLNLAEHITNGYEINTWENRDYKTNKHKDTEEILDEFIQSLQQPKVFDIKIQMLSDNPYDPRSKTGRFEVGDTDKVVIRNNSIKILKKL